MKRTTVYGQIESMMKLQNNLPTYRTITVKVGLRRKHSMDMCSMILMVVQDLICGTG